MLYCSLLTAMALGLPFGLAVFPVHAARYMRAAAAARRGGPEAQPELVAPFQDEVDEPLLLVRSMSWWRGQRAGGFRGCAMRRLRYSSGMRYAQRAPSAPLAPAA